MVDSLMYLQAYSEYQWDQDRRGQSKGLGAPFHGEETALQAPEATAVRPRAYKVSKTSTLNHEKPWYMMLGQTIGKQFNSIITFLIG